MVVWIQLVVPVDFVDDVRKQSKDGNDDGVKLLAGDPSCDRSV